MHNAFVVIIINWGTNKKMTQW